MNRRTEDMLRVAGTKAYAAELFLDKLDDGMKKNEVEMWANVASANALTSIAASLDIIARKLVEEGK